MPRARERRSRSGINQRAELGSGLVAAHACRSSCTIQRSTRFVWLSPPEPDFASKRSGAQEFPAPNGALLSKGSEVASSCWRAAERPLYEKGETKEEEKKKHTNHTQVVALTIHVNTHQ